MKNITMDIVIIGAGPIGLFSAFQAGILGMKNICVIDVFDQVGGQCSVLYPQKPIYDIPGYKKINAEDLINSLYDQASSFNPKYFLSQQVTSLEHDKKHDHFIIETSKNTIINSKVVLIAAGAGAFGPNKPPLADIEVFENKSVFYSVTDKEKLFGKKILIAGGGDTALDWVLELADHADVKIVHRRNKFRAMQDSVEKVRKLSDEGKIDLITGYQLDQLDGRNGILQNVVLKDLDGNKKNVDADILLSFFGLKQDLGPLHSFGLNIKNNNIIVDYPYFQTNIEGVYAIGDVATYEGKLKLILTGFAEAASAIYHSYKRIFDKNLRFEYSTSKGLDSN